MATMRTIHINIPETVELSDYDITMMLAAKLYEDKKLSTGQAAKLAGLSKRTFIEVLGHYGVSLFSTSLVDLHTDIANA